MNIARDSMKLIAVLGIGICAITIVIGMDVASSRTQVECPNGHITAIGDDPNCYSYPRLAEGAMVIGLALAIAVVIALGMWIMDAVADIRDGVRIDLVHKIDRVLDGKAESAESAGT